MTHETTQRGSSTVFEKPQICCIDLEEEISQALKREGFHCREASFGRKIVVKHGKFDPGKIIHLNHNIPRDLLEFDLVIIEMKPFLAPISFNSVNHSRAVTGPLDFAFRTCYPETLFNPRPFATQAFQTEMNTLLERGAIFVIFAGEEEIVQYHEIEITPGGEREIRQPVCTNWDFFHYFPVRNNQRGKKIKLAINPAKPLGSFLQKYLPSLSFEVHFELPTEPVNGKRELAKNYQVLLETEFGEPVSFVRGTSSGWVFVFPQVIGKLQFLTELCKEILPGLFPKMFPFHGQFKWLDDGSYPVPGEVKLKQDLIQIRERFESENTRIEQTIEQKKEEFRFLRSLLVETGEPLVDAAMVLLGKLGFTDIKKVDESSNGLLEEDIQILYNGKTLVIEVKGLGGRSTDADCSQIAKIRFRRMKELNTLEVHGLYLANHQRYLPPEERDNPPFSPAQIGDAENDERALITTYELYKAFFLLEEGLITKEKVREAFLREGLIEISPPNLVPLGKPQEVLKEGYVAILVVNDVLIRKGSPLVEKRAGRFRKFQVCSLRVNDQEVNEAQNGEIGIGLDRPIKRGSELFVFSGETP